MYRLLTEHVRIKNAGSAPTAVTPAVPAQTTATPAAPVHSPLMLASITNAKELLTGLFRKAIEPNANVDQVSVCS